MKIIDQSEFNSYFRRFGKKISSAAIWSMASQSLGAPELYVKLYNATKILKYLNLKINDNNLGLYIKRISISIVFNLIGVVFLLISIAFSLIGVFLLSINPSVTIMFTTSIFLMLLLLILISQIFSYIIEVNAWGHLNAFFFSLNETSHGAGLIESGTKKIRKGCLALFISSLLGIIFVVFGLNSLPYIAINTPDFFELVSTILGLGVLAGIPYFIGRILLTKGYFEISDLKKISS